MTMRKWALVSDIHFPYNNKRWTKMFLDFVKSWQPDHIELVGDIDDACPISKYSEGSSAEYKDLTYTYAPIIRGFLAELREACPNAEIVFHGGNHDARYDSYISRNAPALEGLITPDMLWDVDKLGIDYHSYNAPPVQRYGGYYVHHGLYALKGGGNSAKKMSDEFNISVITGHTHRQAIVGQTFELKNETLWSIELGHLCDVSSGGFNYTQLRDWQPGFGYAYIDEDDGDKVYPFLAQIKDNSCVVDGKLYQA